MPKTTKEQMRRLNTLEDWREQLTFLFYDLECVREPLQREKGERLASLTHSVQWLATELIPSADPMLFQEAFDLVTSAYQSGEVKRVEDWRDVSRSVDRAMLFLQRMESIVHPQSGWRGHALGGREEKLLPLGKMSEFIGVDRKTMGRWVKQGMPANSGTKTLIWVSDALAWNAQTHPEYPTNKKTEKSHGT